MQVQITEGLAGTYEDGITPLFASPGDIIEISIEWAQRLIQAGYAVAMQPDPETSKRKRVTS